MEGILRNEIVYDLLGDPLPIDNDQVDSHIGHIGKWQADRTVYKCDALVREQLNHVIRNAKTKLRGELSRGENQACGFQLSERADKALAALSSKNNGRLFDTEFVQGSVEAFVHDRSVLFFPLDDSDQIDSLLFPVCQ